VTETLTETSPQTVDAIVLAAAGAFRPWAATPAADRARILSAGADALDAAHDELVQLAVAESHLTEGRLSGELARTTFQLRLLGEEMLRGDAYDARIDTADPHWPMGVPRPDLRRVKVPVGPVLVFAGSNFPFAFSVAGGDTASALAAGCPVVVKAHPGHPELSRRTAAILADALTAAGAPTGTLGLIEGQDAGVRALRHPRIAAAAFTGSISGGRFLFDVASQREVPIPFYGELGSTNPVFVTPEAAAEDPDLAQGFLDSLTAGVGQFCTKPGLLVLPRGSKLLGRLSEARLPGPAPMLNPRIRDGFGARLRELSSHADVQTLAGADDPTDSQLDAAPTLLRAGVRDVLTCPDLQEECFGPAALVVEYDDPKDMVALAETLAGQLTATVWGTPESDVADLVAVLTERAGRLLWNQWPTGVSVTHAQQHGGPYPATTAPGTTSVGTAAIERFLRPVAFQNFPQHLLPEALRDENPLGLHQRRD
jgi:NADP-dependent aldehyde dehydrogenase